MDKILNTSNFLSLAPSFPPCTSHLSTRVSIFNNRSLGKNDGSCAVIKKKQKTNLGYMSHLKTKR